MLTFSPPKSRLENLLALTVEKEASDLHLTCGLPPSLRVDGDITPLEADPLRADDLASILEGLLDEEQGRRLKKRRVVELATETDLGRFRISVFYTRGNVSASFRRISPLRSFEELGLPLIVKEVAERLDGLVLVSGAVGMGKSTTLAYIIDLINRRRRARVFTVEDPIEYVHESKRSTVLQLEVGLDTPSFSHALRACFRQDPNVICVGEMRDYRTVSMALKAAETGHLVLSTLHTGTAVATVDRIIDMFPPHQQHQARMTMSHVLQAVICQKLLPRHRSDGRVLAYEVLTANSAVRRMIKDGKEDQLPNLLDIGKDRGMVSMDHSLYNLCQAKAITYKTAMAHCHDPARFRDLEPLDDRED